MTSYYCRYRNSRELSDGRELVVRFSSLYTPATFYDPEEAEEVGETEFFIDGFEVLRRDLPAEVTDAIISELESSARLSADRSDLESAGWDVEPGDYDIWDYDIQQAENLYERYLFGD